MKKPKKPTRAEQAKLRRKVAAMQELSDELKLAREKIVPLLRTIDLEIDVHVLDLRSKRARTIEVILRMPITGRKSPEFHEAAFAAAADAAVRGAAAQAPEPPRGRRKR